MTTNNNKDIATCARCGLNTDINQGRWTKPLCKVGETTYEQHIFNKDVEEIVEEFWSKFSMYDLGYKSEGDQVEDWLRTTLTSYADQRVRDFILKARAKEEGIAELINRGGVDWRDHETRLDLLGKLLFLTHQDNE